MFRPFFKLKNRDATGAPICKGITVQKKKKKKKTEPLHLKKRTKLHQFQYPVFRPNIKDIHHSLLTAVLIII